MYKYLFSDIDRSNGEPAHIINRKNTPRQPDVPGNQSREV